MPALPILLLSQHVETRHSLELLGGGACGYLLKDRVLRLDDFLDAVRRVAEGGTALDPEIVRALVAPLRDGPRLPNLTPRELEVLSFAAEGLPQGRPDDEMTPGDHERSPSAGSSSVTFPERIASISPRGGAR